jgi:hypothetical protein
MFANVLAPIAGDDCRVVVCAARLRQAASLHSKSPAPGEEIAHRVRKSLEEEERIDQRNLLLSSSRCKSRLIKVERTGQ